MMIINKFAIYLPFFLPLLLIFSRTIADLAVILVSILFIFKSIYEKKYEWIKDPLIKYFLFFIFYLLFFNVPASLNPDDSFIYCLTFTRWPLFSLAISYWIIKSDISMKKLTFGIYFAFFIFFIDLWYQYFIHPSGIFGISGVTNSRLTVPFSDNVIPGRFILFYTFIVSTLMLVNKKTAESINFLYYKIILIILIGLFSAFITGERMVFLIFISSSLILIFSITFSQKINNYHFIYLFILFLFSFLIYVFYFDQEIFIRIIISTYSKLMNFWSSDYGEVFLVSLDKWYNNLFFGGGLHQFKNIEPVNGFNFFKNGSIHHAHNLPLNLLVEMGIFGFFFFYLIIFKLLELIFKNYKKNNHITLFIFKLNLIYICFFPLHTHFKFSHNWMNANIWLIIGLIIALNNINDKTNKN